MTQRALILIGSPKGLEKSNSARHGSVFVRALEARGWHVDRVHTHQAVRSDESRVNLKRVALEADLVLLIAPLYVDTLPGPALRAMEILASGNERELPEKKPRFAALIHCGFIEPKHNRAAIDLCRLFARQAGWEWFGSLMLGGGGMPSKRAKRALEEAAKALSGGFPIHEEIAQRADRPSMPRLLYIIGGNLMWRRVAKKQFGVSKDDLLAQPYARSD